MNNQATTFSIEVDMHFTCGRCGYQWSEKTRLSGLMGYNFSIKKVCPACGTNNAFNISSWQISQALQAAGSTNIAPQHIYVPTGTPLESPERPGFLENLAYNILRRIFNRDDEIHKHNTLH